MQGTHFNDAVRRSIYTQLRVKKISDYQMEMITIWIVAVLLFICIVAICLLSLKKKKFKSTLKSKLFEFSVETED